MSVPTRAVNLVAASTNVADIMAAIWADIPNGSWSQVTQTQTTNPGDKSFAIRAPGGALELNFSNDNLSTPSTTTIRVGVNPDGGPGANAITNSEDPAASSANFSGTDRGRQLALTAIGNTQFIWMEWPDAVMALFKDASRLVTPNGIHAGKVFIQPIAALANPGGASQVRMDGHGILGAVPGYSASNAEQWIIDASFYISPRRRQALGQSVDISAFGNFTTAWQQGGVATRTLSDADTDYQFGPDNERVPAPIVFAPYLNNYFAPHFFYKYLRAVSPLAERFGMWRVGLTERYMSIGALGTAGAGDAAICAVPVPDNFIPNP